MVKAKLNFIKSIEIHEFIGRDLDIEVIHKYKYIAKIKSYNEIK